MKRWLTLLLVLGLIVSGLTGCAKKAPQEPQAPSAQATVAVVNMPTQGFVKGSAPKAVANLEIKPVTKFIPGSVIEVTLKNAKWNQSKPTAELNQGWVYGGLFNNDLTVRYTQTGEAGLDRLNLVLPGVIIGPAAPEGDLIASLGGSAGVTGEFTLGKIVAGFKLTADSPIVKVNALEQLAGKILLYELVDYGFSSAAEDGWLKITLPNGVNFSRNPRVYLDDKEVVNIKVADGGRGKNYIQWQDNAITSGFASNRLERIEVRDIFYDIDSRYMPQSIIIAVSGQVLTGAGGSLETIASVPNADARSLSSGSTTFVVGSTTASINGKSIKMDVAPYQKNNRVFIPLRYAANSLSINDSSIIWDQGNQSVTLIKANNVVQVKVGSKDMSINGVTITMDVAPEMVEQRVMLPISWIAQAFGAGVSWDESKKAITLAY